MEIAEKILNLMAERDITKYRLAKDAKIPYTTLIKILDGTTKHPQIDSLKQIADYFDKPVDYFTENTDHEKRVPEWATPKDIHDFKKMLEEDAPVMFDGVPIEGESRQRVLDVLTGLFWDAKQMNKKTYGRKNTKKNTTDNNDKK